jgi:hypothetical protein
MSGSITVPVAAQTMRAQNFLNTMGINVHLEYTDGAYANVANVQADLAYLGISNVRDAVPDPVTWMPLGQALAGMGALAAAGVKFDFVIPSWETNISQDIAQLDAFVTAHPGSISAVEGPNEVNNWPVIFNGQTGEAGAEAFQRAIYAAVHADPKLAGVQVYYMTGAAQINVANLAGMADDAAAHPYPNDGQVAGARFSQEFTSDYVSAAPYSQVITETGYATDPTNPNPGGVTEAVQAEGTIDIFLDGASQGIKQTYLYQLLDPYADPTGANVDDHYGLFDINNNPKLAAVAVHNLTTLLADTGSDAATFTPTALAATLSGLPNTGNSLVMEKSNGTYDLALWNEAPFWNEATQSAVAVPVSTVTVNLGAIYSSVQVFDPLQGPTAIQSYNNVSSIQVALGVDALVVQISGLVPNSTVVAAAASGPPALADSADTADFNGDGKSDIFWQNANGAVAIWDMNGLQATNAATVGNAGPSWHVVASGNFFGTGDADLLWQQDNGTVAIWQMSGMTEVSSDLITNYGTAWHVIATGDFNGDGQSDIVWQNDNGQVAIWMMNGYTPVLGDNVANLGTSWHVRAVGDFNGDGKSDLVWQNDSGAAAIWTMNGLTETGSVDLGNPGASWHVMGTGDFDGNGKSDVLWQNDNGQVAIWLMNGTSYSSGAIIGSPGPAWHVIGAGDYNGDGKSDILFQNDNGEVGTWMMNGLSIAQYGEVTNVGSAWQPVGTNETHLIDGTQSTGTLNATIVNDEFQFTSALAGAHLIAGFDPLNDSVELSAARFGSFATIGANETNTSSGALFNLGGGATLLLQGVATTELAAKNFAFA